MESGELANSNAHHGDDHPLGLSHHKRISNETDIHMDSGYTSLYSDNLTGTSSASTSLSGSSPWLPSSALSASSSSSSARKVFDLEPILEVNQLEFLSPPLHETPTTRSIRQISDFHITTPVQHSAQVETTPTKSNYFSRIQPSPREKYHGRLNDGDNMGGAVSTMHRSQLTPQKRGRSDDLPYIKVVSFSDKLNTTHSYASGNMSFSEHNATENDENSFDSGRMNTSVAFSPINKSASILQESPRRTIGTSTPKRLISRPSTKTIAKCQFLTSSPKGRVYQCPKH